MSQGNSFAFMVLFLWPFIAIWLYKTKSIQLAILWTIIGGFMFLPVKTSVDLPLIPPIGKDSMPVLAALLGLLLLGKRISLSSNHGWVKFLLYLYIFSPVATVMLNGDKILYWGGASLPGLTFHDAISILINKYIFVLPFLMGRQFFRSYESHLQLFKVLTIAGLGYSLLMLYEIRMSPQLHATLYGYFPNSFAQQVRFGGFRPVVFMGHGLWVAFFAVTILIAALTLSKNGQKAWHFSSNKVAYYFFGVLVLCKSVAAGMYGVFAFILIKFTSSKLQMRVALLIVIAALAYPTLAIFKLVPYEKLTDLAASISEERAQSLSFRFENEEVLLDHAAERFYFGWGGWKRNRVFNDETGQNESTTDGRWIITFGQYGWFGFIAEFGLLGISVLRANKALKLTRDEKSRNLISGHALLVCLIMLDQLPNATLAPWMLMVAGILLGRSEEIIFESKRQESNKMA